MQLVIWIGYEQGTFKCGCARLKQLVTGLSQGLLGFKPRPVHMEICDGQGGTGTGLSLRSALPCHYHSMDTPYLFVTNIM